MLFGLHNAPATFQRCMSAIFHGFCEKIVEVLMDDFSIYGTSFDNCLHNLDKGWQRCEETNLVLNWEKCHFMVDEGIVLGIKSLKEALKLTELRLRRLRKFLTPKMSKVFVVFLVMPVTIEGLLKISLKFQSLLRMFFKRIYHLFFRMIVRKLWKL